MSYCGVTGLIVETRRNDREVSFEWKIPNFFSLSSGRGNRYASPDINFCNAQWSLAMHPNGTTQNSTLGWVTLFLFRKDLGPPLTVISTICIRGTEGEENKREKGQEFSENDRACCWFAFHTMSELRKHQSRLVPGNTLTISCSMKRGVLPAARGISSYQDASNQTDDEYRDANALTDESQSLDKQGIEKLSEDIGKLLVSRDNGDVTVQVRDVEFKVHKLIVCARSPVLSAMFEHETAERASNRICIRDCEPDIFRDFLQYLYKGSIQSLTEKNVFGIYYVADKYLADDLKLQCLKHIRDTLCVQTFSDTVKLALTHREYDLLQLAIEFATKNIPSIIRSVEWQNFNKEFPTEANEILIKCIRP